MQKGIKNEYRFVYYFNNKKIKQLSKEAQQLLYTIYDGDNLTDDTSIECWRSKYNEKADIKIRINNIIHGISIKTGKQCSMHQENKYSFYKFLSKIGVPNPIITNFNNFMLGIINNEKVKGNIYIQKYSQEINQIIDIFNKYYIKTNLIIRFIFQGSENQLYDCDAIIYGTPNNFLWASKDEILSYLINTPTKLTGCINISNLNIKCYNRNLKNDISNMTKENDIQVKWYTLEEDLTEITENRKNFEKLNNH